MSVCQQWIFCARLGATDQTGANPFLGCFRKLCNNLQNVVAITYIFTLQQPTFQVCNFLHFYFTINKYDARIILDGEELTLKDPAYAIQKGITLIPEDRRRLGVILMHTLKENINLPSIDKLKKGVLLNHKMCNSMAEQCVEEYGIVTDGIDLPVQKLSGGNQQKVVISKWFKTDPKLILMDEPTAGVDIGAKGEIVRMIREFSESGKSVIFVSSELAEIMAVCDRVLVYSKGRLIREIDHSEITSEEVLQNAIQQ